MNIETQTEGRVRRACTSNCPRLHSQDLITRVYCLHPRLIIPHRTGSATVLPEASGSGLANQYPLVVRKVTDDSPAVPQSEATVGGSDSS